MSVKNKPRLGKGLSGLLSQPVAVAVPDDRIHENDRSHLAGAAANGAESGVGSAAEAGGAGRLVQVPVEALRPGKHQPRREMDETALERLAASIRTAGVMQPIAVRRIAGADGAGGTGTLEIVAGERRWRAAQRAGLKVVPVIVMDLDDRSAAEWALIENLQREDLNAIERGIAFQRLHEMFGLSYAQIGDRIGMDRSSVANMVRLVELEPEIRRLIAGGALSAGHGKALLSIEAGARRIALAERAAREQWPVRRLESAVTPEHESMHTPEHGGATSKHDRREIALRELEKQLGEHLGTRVRLSTRGDGTKGRLTIEFFSLDHFDGLMRAMGFQMKS